MGKASRLRAERKATSEEVPLRPQAKRVTRPSIAKDARKRQAAAFRAWQQLPLEARRAPLKGTALDPERTNTETTPNPNEKDASA